MHFRNLFPVRLDQILSGIHPVYLRSGHLCVCSRGGMDVLIYLIFHLRSFILENIWLYLRVFHLHSKLFVLMNVFFKCWQVQNLLLSGTMLQVWASQVTEDLERVWRSEGDRGESCIWELKAHLKRLLF